MLDQTFITTGWLNGSFMQLEFEHKGKS